MTCCSLLKNGRWSIKFWNNFPALHLLLRWKNNYSGNNFSPMTAWVDSDEKQIHSTTDCLIFSRNEFMARMPRTHA